MDFRQIWSHCGRVSLISYSKVVIWKSYTVFSNLLSARLRDSAVRRFRRWPRDRTVCSTTPSRSASSPCEGSSSCWRRSPWALWRSWAAEPAYWECNDISHVSKAQILMTRRQQNISGFICNNNSAAPSSNPKWAQHLAIMFRCMMLLLTFWTCFSKTLCFWASFIFVSKWPNIEE